MSEQSNGWLGLLLTDALALENQLCCCDLRPNVFGMQRDTAGNAKNPCRDHNAMMFRVLGTAFNFAKERGLLQQQLADSLKITTNKVGKFLRGDLSGNPNWKEKFATGMNFIFLGSSNAPEVREVLDRVKHYFLRDSNTIHGIPSFFVPERRYIGSPCSLQEVAYEINRITRTISNQAGKGRLAIAGMSLGERGLLPCWHHPGLESAIDQAVKNGIQTSFLHPENDHVAQREMETYLNHPQRKGYLGKTIQLPPAQTHLLNPYVQFVFYEQFSLENPAPMLLMVRAGTNTAFPLSWAADDDERIVFSTWLDSVHASKGKASQELVKQTEDLLNTLPMYTGPDLQPK